MKQLNDDSGESMEARIINADTVCTEKPSEGSGLFAPNHNIDEIVSSKSKNRYPA